MSYAEAAGRLMRRKAMEEIWGRMTSEEKMLFAQTAAQRKDKEDIMAALQRQSQQIQELHKLRQTFAEDFAGNLAGNLVYGGAVWLARKLFT